MQSREADDSHAIAAVPGPRHVSWSIFLVSVLGLFLELLIIRWVSTEIRIFAYLQNTVLVVCFLGIGMGCFACRRQISLSRAFLALALLTLLLAVPLTRSALAQITPYLSQLNDLLIWQGAQQRSAMAMWPSITLGLTMTLGLMVLIWEIFLPIGQLLGRLMERHPRTIVAYSINIVGSLAGIAVFWLLSSWSTSPFVWFVVAAILCLPFLMRASDARWQLAWIGLFVAAAWFGCRDPEAREVVWSPYQKLALMDSQKAIERGHYRWPGDYFVLVNNAGYQGIIDLRPETVRNMSTIPVERRGLSQYDIPLMVHPAPRRVLIVGAGTGNDVAGALRGGADEIVAVEIDPAIIEMGRNYHPERPYDSPKVTVVNDDARSYFETSDRQFDLVIFGLLDSHTTTSMTNARLDHYVYTRESIARARSLLAPGGVMVLSFEAVKPYMVDRMARCLREEFGTAPTSFRVPGDSLGWGGMMFITGDGEHIRQGLEQHPALAQTIATWQQQQQPFEPTYTAEVATDDWPYIYLVDRSIPRLYFCLALLMALLVMYCKFRLGSAQTLTAWRSSHWHFFFLGAAFLLLEVQNISKAAVVLGNTWQVNAVIISGIMLMILLANWVAATYKQISPRLVHLGLLGSCLGLYFLDLSIFNTLPYLLKASAVGLFTTLPMFFSGLVFIRSFAAVERKDLALGANMIGALVGGMLQSITFVVGVRGLLLVVAALYLAALATRLEPRDANQPLDDPSEDLADRYPPREETADLEPLSA